MIVRFQATWPYNMTKTPKTCFKIMASFILKSQIFKTTKLQQCLLHKKTDYAAGDTLLNFTAKTSHALFTC